jgi:transcriptional regulator with XRE-family HTH domain
MMSNRRNASISLSSDVLAWLLGRGLSQAEIARLLGVSQGFISLVKSRERALTLDHLSGIAEVLQVPLGAMLVQVSPQPRRGTAETAALFEVTERMMRKADAAQAAIRAHLAATPMKKG